MSHGMKEGRGRYPTFEHTIRPSNDGDIDVHATVSLDSKPLVTLYQSHDTEITLTPVEAERLGRALFRAADCARAKIEWSRKNR